MSVLHELRIQFNIVSLLTYLLTYDILFG